MTWLIGWEAGIRTPIPWSRATCPTVERPPSTGQGRPQELCTLAASTPTGQVPAGLSSQIRRPLPDHHARGVGLAVDDGRHDGRIRNTQSVNATDPDTIRAIPGVPVALLTGSVKGRERKRVLAGLADGSIPLVLGTGPGAEERRAVAVVVIGGQALCLLLTLVVTPVAYSLLDDLAQKLQWRHWRLEPTEAAKVT